MPKPAMNLAVPDRVTGEVAVIHPDTGKVLVLAEATESQLADWKRAMIEWRRMATAAEEQVDAELVRRMDARASWTYRGDGFKLTSQSPKPSVSYREPEKLRKRLLKLADEGLLDPAAIDAALPVKPEEVMVKVGPLSQLEKLGGRVARAVKTHRVERPKHGRGVRVS